MNRAEEEGLPATMAHEEAAIDWAVWHEVALEGRLLELLVKLPRERWAERDEFGQTFLHRAFRGPNIDVVVALLTSGRVDANARDHWRNTPAWVAAAVGQPRALEVLCAAGADLRAHNVSGETPVDVALRRADEDDGETVRVLVANGVRLTTVNAGRQYITPALEAFERGVLRCRAVVVAMLRVKRASGKLVRWDKFLLAELAVCLWSTRYDKRWQN